MNRRPRTTAILGLSKAAVLQIENLYSALTK